jgi:O-antigen/teichoic acid export membrane protein
LCDGIKTLATQVFGSQLRRNMTSGMLTTGINMFIILASYPIYLHYLGYEKYGLWLILAVVLGFAQLGNLGINQAIMKLVAEEYGRENIQGIRSYVTMAWTVLTITGSIALLAILLFKSQIVAAFKLSGENADLVSWLLPYIGALTIYVFLVQSLNATLAGLGRMDLSNYILAAGQLCAALISVLLLWSGRGIEGLLIGNASSFVVVHIASMLFIRRQINKLGFLRRDNWDLHRLKKLLHFGGVVFSGTLISILMDPFNKLMLSRYAGVATVPVYDIAYKGSMQVRGLMEVGIRAIMPEISRIGANMTSQAHERITAINRRAMKYIIIYGIPIFVTLFILAPVLLKVWLQNSFIDMLPLAFRIMLIASFVSLLGVPAFYTHMGQGRVRYCFISYCIQSLINASIALACSIFVPNMLASCIFYAVALGVCGSTAYLIWQLHRSNKNKEGESLSVETSDKMKSCAIWLESKE